MKYTVLIVEDEVVERSMLEDMLLKGYPEISEIYLASNGIEGLKLAQKKQPDIILADISMPGLTGLELMRVLREHSFRGKVLFTTAYSSFDYAKEAISLGAVGYLLKPLMEDELKENLTKCFLIIDQERKNERLSEGMESICSYAERYLLHDFLKGTVHAAALAGAYGFSEDRNLRARLIVFHFWHLLSTAEENSVLSIARAALPDTVRLLMSFERNELVILADWDKELPEGYLEVAAWVFFQAVLSKLPDDIQPEWASATSLCSAYSALKEGYDWLESDNRKGGSGSLRFTPSLGPSFYGPRDREARIKKAVWGLKDGTPSRLTGSFHSLFSQDRNSYEGLYLVLRSLLEYDSSVDLMDVFLAVDPKNVSGSLDKWCRENFEGKEKGGKVVIEEALRLMRTEYSSPNLSQTVVAERFGLNPAYFSRLFKKETGQKFITVMTDIRMTKAKELLDEGLSADEVGERCGYSSRQYFLEAFRNRYGMSVATYLGKKG